MTRNLQLATLALTLWLAGCASVPRPGSAPEDANQASAASPSSSSDTSRGTASASKPATRARGPLQPIKPTALSSQDVVALSVPPDLWTRIRGGFAMPDLDSDLVHQHEQWYQSRPDYIQRMTERSRKYLFHIVEELERRGMPTELALLPYIESAFNPQAVSSARAAGMWQFMPATGQDFELRQNIFRDDRRDVLASTRAALDYLQKLHGMFGDWHLALAAYNWGQGNVSKAIARNQRAGLPTTYEALNMPVETRNYVPKLQAVKNIVANPDGFRAELPLIENHPYFQTVDIDHDMDVELAARLADIHLDDFKALNPSLNHKVILAAGTPQILLPWDNAQVFKRNFEAYDKGQYASWTAWAAPATMTVAEAARRVGMSEADMRSINNIPPRMLIRGGSVLVVPRSGKSQEDVSSAIADNAQLNLAPEIVTRRTTIRAHKRETVASVAARYHLKAADVAGWNDVGTSARFKPGEQVVVYLPVRSFTRRAVSAHAPQAKVRVTAKAAPKGRSVARSPGKGRTVSAAKTGRTVQARTKAKPVTLAGAR